MVNIGEHNKHINFICRPNLGFHALPQLKKKNQRLNWVDYSLAVRDIDGILELIYNQSNMVWIFVMPGLNSNPKFSVGSEKDSVTYIPY